MPDISVNIEIFCSGCGKGICNNASTGKTRGRGQEYFDIEPCKNCLENAKREGYDEGYNDAERECRKSDA